MIKPNIPEGNQSKPTFGGLASNTRLIPPNTTPTTTNKSSKHSDDNSFQKLSSIKESLTIFHNHSDWLSVSFERLSESQFKELINLTGRGLIVLEKGTTWSNGEKAKTYENSITSPIGLKGAYSCCQTEDSTNTFYDVRGNYFDFQRYWHETDEKDPDNPITVHYFGAKGSKKVTRVYNHKNKSLRLETQFRGKYAQVAFEAIANLERDDKTDEEWTKIIQKTIGGIAVGVIDFRDKSKLKNKSKACKSKTKRFPFWQDLIDNVGAVHMIRIPKIKPDLETHQATFDWLEKMASKTLAILFYVIGQERFISYIYRLVELGESKFTPQDKKKIEYLRSNSDYLNFD